MPYYVLLDPKLNLADPSLNIQFDGSALVEGLTELKQRLADGKTYQVAKIPSYVLIRSGQTTQSYFKPDEILAHYPTITEALAKEREAKGRSLSKIAALLLSYTDEPGSDTEETSTEIGHPPALGATCYALSCLSLAAASEEPRALDAATLGISTLKPQLSEHFPSIQAHAKDTLYETIFYHLQITRNKKYVDQHQLEKMTLDPSNMELLQPQISCETVYLALNNPHSYFVIFDQNKDDFFIKSIELDTGSCQPTTKIWFAGKTEAEAAMTLNTIFHQDFSDQGKLKPYGFSLLKLNIKPADLMAAFETFHTEFASGQRIWGKKAFYKSVPGHRNCHSFIYALLQKIVAQKAANSFAEHANPSFGF